MQFRLTEIEVNNFLSYKDTKFSDLNDYNILIGKNNSGKSNFFKILNAIKDNFINNKYNRLILFDGNEQEKASLTLTYKLSEGFRTNFFTALNDANYFSNGFLFNNDQSSSNWNSKTLEWLIREGYFELVSIKISWIPDLRDLIVESVISVNKNAKTIIYKFEKKEQESHFTFLEKVHLTGAKTFRAFFEKSFKTKSLGSFDPSSLNSFYTNQIDGRIAGLDIKNYSFLPLRFIVLNLMKPFFESIFYLPDNRYFEGSNEITDLDKTKPSFDGNNIGKFLANIKINDPGWHNELNKDIKDFFPYIEDFSSKIENNKTIFHSKEKNLESLFRLENLGAGILHFINYLINFKFYGKDGTIFLLEEPELFIFPGLQKLLRDYFIEKSKSIQIFITTHSPNFLSKKFEKCSIYQIKKENVISKVKKISESEIIEVFQELNLDLYDYLLYDGILFVEGANDLRVFNTLINTIVEEKIKIISCEGKRNAQYYAEARILKLLKGNNLKSLFLFDSDRGNENIWNRFQNDKEYQEELEKITLKLPYYELENIFLQPILIFDYLWSKGKIQNLNEDSNWLIETIKNVFEISGKNSKRYILKKFTDTYFFWIPVEYIEKMIERSKNVNDFKDLFKMWTEDLEHLIRNLNFYYKNFELKKDLIIDEFNYNKEIYDYAIENKNYNHFVSGKDVFISLKTMITDKFHLSKSISPEILAEHLIEFLSDFNYWIKNLEISTITDKEDNVTIVDEPTLNFLNEQYIKQMPFQEGFKKESENNNGEEFENDVEEEFEDDVEEEFEDDIDNEVENRFINDFKDYCERIKTLILNITDNLSCNFNEKFSYFRELNFYNLLSFLISRWIIKK